MDLWSESASLRVCCNKTFAQFFPQKKMRVFRKFLEGFRRKNQIETFMPNNFDFSYTSPSSIFSPLPSSFVGDNLSFFLSTRMATTIQGNVATTVDQKKRALRMKIRKDLRSMPLSHRRQEGLVWFNFNFNFPYSNSGFVLFHLFSNQFFLIKILVWIDWFIVMVVSYSGFCFQLII